MFDCYRSPEAAGISSGGILAFLDAVKASGDELHGLVMLRHGKIVCDMAWFPYRNSFEHMLFSLTKSFTSCAVGLAIADGRLSLESRIADILPDKLPENPSDALLSITVSDLLCMGSGLDPASDKLGNAADPDMVDLARRTLSFPVLHIPGEVFQYNSMGSHLLSVVVERVTGETLRDYLTPRLFVPLGMEVPAWEQDGQGHTMGGWGLSLNTRQIAAFGQLLLQKGVWNGIQVLPAGWVETATAKHISNGDPASGSDWAQGYGYQFWRCAGGFYRGDGMYGQLCCVLEAQDVVIAVTAGLQDMAREMALIHQHLIPAIDAPPSNHGTQEMLQKRIDSLAHPMPIPGDPFPMALCGTYAQDKSRIITLEKEGDLLSLTLTAPDVADVLCVTLQAREVPTLRQSTYGSYVASYHWADHALDATVRILNGPFSLHLYMEFEENAATVKLSGIPIDEEKQLYRKVQHAAKG